MIEFWALCILSARGQVPESELEHVVIDVHGEYVREIARSHHGPDPPSSQYC
jgi:hypothetical protein